MKSNIFNYFKKIMSYIYEFIKIIFLIFLFIIVIVIKKILEDLGYI